MYSRVPTILYNIENLEKIDTMSFWNDEKVPIKSSVKRCFTQDLKAGVKALCARSAHPIVGSSTASTTGIEKS